MPTDFPVIEMEHAKLVSKLCKGGDAILESLTPAKVHILHMAIGICGEVGEVISEVNTISDSGKYSSLSPEEMERLLSEFGDLEFYMRGMAQGLGAGCYARTVTPSSFYTEGQCVLDMIKHSSNLMEMVKKYVMYDDKGKVPLIESSLIKLREALDRFYAVLHCSPGDAMRNNIAKLSKRYAGAGNSVEFSNAAAIKQVDKDG